MSIPDAMACTHRSFGAASNSGFGMNPRITSASPAMRVASRIVAATRTVEPGGAAIRIASSSASLIAGNVRPSVTRMSTGPSSRNVSIMIAPSDVPPGGGYQDAPRRLDRVVSGAHDVRMLARIAPHEPSPAAVAALAPHGVLRAAINLSNPLLVSGREPDGTPIGVSPDMARELARRLGVPLELRLYDSPGDLADDAVNDAWDIGNIGAEPARAESIAFTAAYCEIECTYLVPAGSPIASIDDVDRAGVRIASAPRAAYDLWLERNLRHAELVRSDTLGGSFELFVAQGLDALAGLRPGLLSLAKRLPGARVLDGQFSAVQQAMGTPLGRDRAGFEHLASFVEEAKTSGFVTDRIAAHRVVGLTVAPPDPSRTSDRG